MERHVFTKADILFSELDKQLFPLNKDIIGIRAAIIRDNPFQGYYGYIYKFSVCVRRYFYLRRLLVALCNFQDCLIAFVQIKFSPGRICGGKGCFQFLFGFFILFLIIINNSQFTVGKVLPEMEAIASGSTLPTVNWELFIIIRKSMKKPKR